MLQKSFTKNFFEDGTPENILDQKNVWSTFDPVSQSPTYRLFCSEEPNSFPFVTLLQGYYKEPNGVVFAN